MALARHGLYDRAILVEGFRANLQCSLTIETCITHLTWGYLKVWLAFASVVLTQVVTIQRRWREG